MIDLVKVVRVEPLGGHRLRLHFTNGDVGEMNFADIVQEGGPMVEPLKDEAFFARVFVQNGVPVWPNGFDVDAIALHMDMAAAGMLSRPAVSAE